MVFNSNGKTYLNQFTYNNVDIETVANYCYLGMVLKFDGNFNLAINGTRGSQDCNRSPGSKLLSITTQLHCGGQLGGRA